MVDDKQDDELGYYAVAFLDVMGQRSLIRELKGLPADQDEYNKAVHVLRDTVGYLRRLRRMFDGMFKTMNTTTPIFDSIPKDKQDLARAMRRNEVSYRWFADSLVAAVPLRNEDEHCTSMNGIFSTMWASCCTAVAALADGKRLRGAIDVGWAVEIEPGEVYGSALERASA